MSVNPLLDVVRRSTRLSNGSKESYERCIQRFIDFVGDRVPNGAQVECWRDHLSMSVGPRTVNKHLYALRYATARLESLGLGQDFARSAETMRTPKAELHAMSVEEVRALMHTCNAGKPADLRDYAVMQTALRTALRSENVVMMRFEDIRGRRVHIIQKGGKPHAPVLDDRSLGALGAWTGWLASAGVAPTGPIFRAVSQERVDGLYHVGDPIKSRTWFNKMLARRAEVAELGRSIHPHLFRHTCISWLLERGVAPSRVMAQTGQATLATLSQYVTDLAAEDDPIGEYLPDF